MTLTSDEKAEMEALCKQIAVEKDPAKFHKLMVELNNLLERATTYPFNNQSTAVRTKAAQCDRTPNPGKVQIWYATVQTFLTLYFRIGDALAVPPPERTRKCVMASSAKPEFKCSICNKRVDLETSKTDDRGKAVHEQSYVLRHALKDATQPTTLPLAS